MIASSLKNVETFAPSLELDKAKASIEAADVWETKRLLIFMERFVVSPSLLSRASRLVP